MLLEKDFQTKFNRWLLNVYKVTGAYELKATKGLSIGFNSVVAHQIHALRVAKNSVLVHKIPDLGNQNPFDCFCLAKEQGFVVIMFSKEVPGQKNFVIIDVDDYVNEMETSKRKSLTFDRACEIGTLHRLG